VAALLAVPTAARSTGKPRWAAALVTSRHAAGLAALRDGQAGAALELLDDAAGDADGEVAAALRCDAALAAVATGDRDRAAARLKAIAKLRCPFPAPADTQAVPILTAFVDGLNPRRAGKAVDRLAALAKSATGVSKHWRPALRVVAMSAADQAYRAGKLDQARKHLATARAVEVRAGADELAYDLAALDLADGKLDAARAGFAKVAGRVPEALIGAGIVADREGDSAKALDLWRQAKKAGARLGVLDDWIAAKERIFGGGGDEAHVIAALVAALAGTAAAAPVTSACAPSTPFDGTARLDFANKLAAHLAGADGVGRVYGKASDFAAALAKGDVQLAVVDAEFLATTGAPHTALAVAVRDGDTAAPWQLVARGAAGILELRGKTVLVPITDGRHAAFVDNALLGGELAAGFWKIEPSPDALSAVAAVGLGKADAAVVPSGVALPAGVTRVATLPSVSWPVLIAARTRRPRWWRRARARSQLRRRRRDHRLPHQRRRRLQGAGAADEDGAAPGAADRAQPADHGRRAGDWAHVPRRAAAGRRLLRAAVTIACAGRPRRALPR
jgi:hypothetical protein